MNEFIGRIFLFNGCDADLIDRSYGITDEVLSLSFGNEEVILSPESGIRGIYVVTEGGASIESGASSRRSVLRLLEVGDTFGAAYLFSEKSSHKTTVIARDSCTVSVIPEKTVKRIVENESRAAFNYIEFLSDRIEFLNRRISAFAAGSAEEKLAVYLSSLPMGNGRYSLEVSYSTLADMLGIGRASLYRALDSFESEGMIGRDGRNIEILDSKKLDSLIN